MTTPNTPLSYAYVSHEGRLVSAMGLPALQALRDRCTAYKHRCDAAGRDPHPDKAELERVVNFYLDKLLANKIHDAYAYFEQQRQRALDAGYMVPGLPAGLDRDVILQAAQACHEAACGAEPLRGEDPALTRRIFAELQAALSVAMDGARK